MRRRLGCVALLLATSGAQGQFAAVTVPDPVYIGVPFKIEVTLDCPPPGEAPPPFRCDGLTTVAFTDVSDKTAAFPEEWLFLNPWEPVSWGPFVFHKAGENYIQFLADDPIGFVGAAVFMVVPPKGPVRKRGEVIHEPFSAGRETYR